MEGPDVILPKKKVDVKCIHWECREVCGRRGRPELGIIHVRNLLITSAQEIHEVQTDLFSALGALPFASLENVAMLCLRP